MYSRDIPMLARLADEAADSLVPKAPAVQINTPLNSADCGLADEDLESRRSLKKIKPESVTEVELGQAATRFIEVSAQNRDVSFVHSPVVLPSLPDDAPAWGQALHQGLQIVANAVAANSQAIADNARAIAANGRAIDSVNLRLVAVARNARIRSSNSRCRNNGGDLIALVKENAAPMENQAEMAVWDPELSGLPVNSVPPQQLFPKNLNRLERLSESSISRLILFYNDDFGIGPEDTLATKRSKLKSWIS